MSSKSETNTEYNLYIPNISTYQRWYFDIDVYNLIEVNIGHIQRMDFVDIEYMKGSKYISVYIKLEYWHENKYTQYLRKALEMNYAKIFYDGPYYWLVYKNTSHIFPTKTIDNLELLKVHREEDENYSIVRFKDNIMNIPYESGKYEENDLETIVLDIEEHNIISTTNKEEIIPAGIANINEEVMNYDINECRIKCRPMFKYPLYPFYKNRVNPVK